MTDKQVVKTIALAACAGFVVGSGVVVLLANLMGWYK